MIADARGPVLGELASEQKAEHTQEPHSQSLLANAQRAVRYPMNRQRHETLYQQA